MLNQLARLFDAAAQPVYALDDRRKIVYCNAACAAWVGLAAEQLIGQRCDYHVSETGRTPVEVAARLCPPPTVFSGASLVAEIDALRADGEVLRRYAQFLPLHSSEGEQVGVLAVATDLPPPASLAPPAEADLLHDQLRDLARELRGAYRVDRLVGESPASRLAREQVRLAIATRAHVQIVGPAGSGREHIARTIHCGFDAARAGPLLPLSCPLLDAELLQTTVLAFLRRANEATVEQPASLLLLDVDQLSEAGQAELLAFLQVPTFPLRLLVTTRRPLLALARESAFHGDLAHRLGAIVIELSPLASRREDIPQLCQRFVEDFNATGGRQFAGLTPAVLDHLCSMPWPGNLDELASVIRELCENSEPPYITNPDASRRVKLVTAAGVHPRVSDEAIQLTDFLRDVEREVLQRALQRAKGNKAKAARLLGISRTRLLNRLAKLGLQPPMN